MPLAGDDIKDHDGGGKLHIHNDRNIFNVFADPPVVLPVDQLVQILFNKEPEHPRELVLELVKQSHHLDLPQLLGGIRDEQYNIK